MARPLHGPEFGSYAADDVTWLLTDLSHVELEAPVVGLQPQLGSDAAAARPCDPGLAGVGIAKTAGRRRRGRAECADRGERERPECACQGHVRQCAAREREPQ